MTFTPLIVDLAAAAILLFSALRGRSRGLIKTLAGILAVVLAFSCAGFLAEKATPYISEKYVSPYITSAIEPKSEELTPQEAASDPTAVGDLFLDLGFSENIVHDAISDFTEAMTKSIVTPIVAMTNSIAYKITYSVLFVIFFLLSLLVLTLLFKILNLASKIPGINFINKTLGLILGIILGYLILVALSFVMLKFGIVLDSETVNKTFLLKNILSFSPITALSATLKPMGVEHLKV
ncbi:MAG: CvpA family protein [Oscillospiraceae bacterium]|nr:CvpA family protein [Oscillospiraceae bacterium]